MKLKDRFDKTSIDYALDSNEPDLVTMYVRNEYEQRGID